MVISPIIKIFSSTELNEGSASFELYWLPVIFYLSGCPSICLRFTLKFHCMYMYRVEEFDENLVRSGGHAPNNNNLYQEQRNTHKTLS